MSTERPAMPDIPTHTAIYRKACDAGCSAEQVLCSPDLPDHVREHLDHIAELLRAIAELTRSHDRLHALTLRLTDADLDRLALVQAYYRRPIAGVDGGTILGPELSAEDVLRAALGELAEAVEPRTTPAPLQPPSDSPLRPPAP